MKLSVTTTTVEPTRDDIRRGIEDSAALVRLARRFEVRVTARGIVGKRLRSVRGERG